ncbi:MAG: FMN-binding protein [Candidatus Izimaplasma sp.]|nr:FMN-binding protein [Candidatus Izimaplasma bacterium]
MKHVKIIITLMIVVIVATIGVSQVEQYFRPLIKAEAIKAANKAKFKVLPGLETTDDLSPEEGLDFGDTRIQEVIKVEGKGYIYTAKFQGFDSQIEYLLGIDMNNKVTGYITLYQGDTPGYGAQIGDPENWEQFAGKPLEDLQNGDIDGLSGATITTAGWVSSLKKVSEFHETQFGDGSGGPIETPEEKLLRQKKEILPEGVTLTDYTPTQDITGTGITSIEVANDGTNDVAVLYTAEFVGYNEDDIIEYIISFDLDSGNVIGYKTLYANDTAGLGNEIINSDNWIQFEGKDYQELLDQSIDKIAGATVTTNAWSSSLQKVTQFHRQEFEGEVILTKEERIELAKEALFPTGVTFTDITESKKSDFIVTKIFEVKNDSDEVIGTLYLSTTIGASYSEPTYIQFLMGVDTENNLTGLMMVDDSETEGRADTFYEESYDDSIEGSSIESDLEIDAVAGSTITKNALQEAVGHLIFYHLNYFVERVDPLAVDTVELEAAYPTATTFESVYLDYDYNEVIGNIYAAKDASDAVIGYVYYAKADGNNDEIEIWFTWGVALDGTTQQLNIVSDSETWDGAAGQYGTYDGSFGTNFTTTTWLDLFEGVTFTSLQSDPVDTVSGVTNSTGGMRTTIDLIITYHFEQSVGGAN